MLSKLKHQRVTSINKLELTVCKHNTKRAASSVIKITYYEALSLTTYNTKYI